MNRKSKFKPIVTRIELNPEQAVLTCDCYVSAGGYNLDTGYRYSSSLYHTQSGFVTRICSAGVKTKNDNYAYCNTYNSGGGTQAYAKDATTAGS